MQPEQVLFEQQSAFAQVSVTEQVVGVVAAIAAVVRGYGPQQ